MQRYGRGLSSIRDSKEEPALKADLRFGFAVAFLLGVNLLCSAAEPQHEKKPAVPQPPTYVIVNEDWQFPYSTEYSIFLATGTDTAPSLTLQSVIQTYTHFGSFGGFFGTPRIASAPDVNTNCVYLSNSGDNTISAVALDTQQLVNVYTGSLSDSGSPNGIGLAVTSKYLYAGYSSSNTIGVFSTDSGCGLTFLQDVPAAGKNGGGPTGIAVNGNILVLSYGDGSIQSFDVTNGIPVPNHDLQNSLGFAGPVTGLNNPLGNIPNGVDLSQDGRWAIFGDTATVPVVEVSSLFTFAHEQLARTRAWFTLGTGVDAGTVHLSPDGTLLYMVNSESGTVSAAFFNTATGLLTPGCTSAPLQGFNTAHPWYGQVVTRDTTGTGKVLYVAEFGRGIDEQTNPSAIGILTVLVNGNKCTITESPNSPVMLTWPGALSLGAYPPRPY